MGATSRPERIVVIGATSAIAAACLRLWAADGAAELVLVGRNGERLDALAAELRSLNPAAAISRHVADFLDAGRIDALAGDICRAGPVDIALVAHGFLPDPGCGHADLALVKETLEISGLSPCLFAEAFAKRMEKANRGTLALVGSVAGDRARKSNYPYGAAKSLVESYAEGLWHRLARTRLRVVLIKPGPTDTPLAAHHKRNGVRLASPERVARDIVSGIASGKAVIYTPGYWRAVMAALRLVPRSLFKRLDI